MQKVEKITKRIINRENLKSEMKKIEIDERTDQIDQFEENDDINRKI